MNLAHAYFFKIRFNIVLAPNLRFFKLSVSLTSSNRTVHSFHSWLVIIIIIIIIITIIYLIHAVKLENLWLNIFHVWLKRIVTLWRMELYNTLIVWKIDKCNCKYFCIMHCISKYFKATKVISLINYNLLKFVVRLHVLRYCITSKCFMYQTCRD